jgi:hypothetical protein
MASTTLCSRELRRRDARVQACQQPGSLKLAILVVHPFPFGAEAALATV